MADRLNWEKANKRDLVKRRGSLSVWTDGWAPELRDVAGDLAAERDIDVPMRLDSWKYLFRVVGNDGKQLTLCYRFLTGLPEHKNILLRNARRLRKKYGSSFPKVFRTFLSYDYRVRVLRTDRTDANVRRIYGLRLWRYRLERPPEMFVK